jgi:phage-related baseplate assembly protein
MATVDLAQLPPPQIIEVLDFEVILADVKAVMIAAFLMNNRLLLPLR